MKNILIVGGGIAGEKFIKFLVVDTEHFSFTLCKFGILNKTSLLAEKYKLKCLMYNELDRNNVNSFDCIILCVPVEVKMKITSHIIELGYRNVLLMEKPLAVTQKECEDYYRLLSCLKQYYVCYWRDFSDCNVDWIKNGKAELIYASVFHDLKDDIVHNLPHILDWILITYGSIDCVHIESADERTLYGFINDERLVIEFDNCGVPVYILNDKLLMFDQKTAYQKMLLSVFYFQKEDSVRSIQNSAAIAKILEEALLAYENRRS